MGPSNITHIGNNKRKERYYETITLDRVHRYRRNQSTGAPGLQNSNRVEARMSLFNRPPPGGWKPEDKVPEKYRSSSPQEFDGRKFKPWPDGFQTKDGRNRILPSRSDAILAIHSLRFFIGKNQLQAVKSGMVGEEKQFFFDTMVELANVVAKMPKTKETEGQKDAVAHLHYFAGGQANFYIFEKDIGCADDEPEDRGKQTQAFGLADLFGDGGELGYISIQEIIDNNGELDFYWTPKTLDEIRKREI